MKLSFFNVDDVANDLLSVTNHKTVSSKKGYTQDGLFSEMIFGPTKTATCLCGIYHGRAAIGNVCPKCGLKISYSSDRRKNFARIELPFPILNPIMYDLIHKAGKTKAKDLMEDLLYNDKIFGYLYNKEKCYYTRLEKPFKEKESDEEIAMPEIPENCEFISGLSGIKRFVDIECEHRKDTDKYWRYVFDNIDKFYLNNVLVIPPEYRPSSKTMDAHKMDELNRYYGTILTSITTMKNDHVDTTKLIGISDYMFRNLQKHVFELYNYIFSKLSKKEGLIRGSILGKRLDYCGRAVICPDPTLKVTQCSIPYVMALELYKLDVANYLIERRKYKRYDRAIDWVDECISLCSFDLYDIVCKVVKGKHIILNRQPTLHRMGMLGFEVFVNKDWVIKIHPLACDPYNADFDGDTMACYRPLYETTEEECKNLVRVDKNLLSPSTGCLMLTANQDIVLGLFLLTEDVDDTKRIPIPEHITRVFGEKTYTTEGRLKFNSILPSGYAFINDTITKKVLRTVTDDIARIYSSDIVCEVLDKMKELGFESTTRNGVTMSLRGMNMEGIKDIVHDICDSDIPWQEKMEKMKSQKLTDMVKKKFPYSKFIESGSRGSWDQANQIILARGFVADFKGNVVPEPIKNNLVHGLTQAEFFRSCYGSRKGLLDTAINTANSGYLTRQLVYCGCNLEHDKDVHDCHTTRTLDLIIPAEGDNSGEFKPLDMLRCLVGRYIVTGKDSDGNQILERITFSNYHKYQGMTISVRSPIFCKSPKICKTCYGDTSEILHSPYVGIIAAQALGEIATQMVLRTFHISGSISKVASVTNESGKTEDKSDDIVAGLSTVTKIFHATEKIDWYNSILKLFKMYTDYNKILLVHYECIMSQMMRDSEDKRWRLSDQNDSDIVLASIVSVPIKESWLLGAAFSKPQFSIIDGMVEESKCTDGIIESILSNQKF